LKSVALRYFNAAGCDPEGGIGERHDPETHLIPLVLREALRVTGGGPLLIKDHVAGAPLDRLRLWLLDVLGNAPRGFMIEATYLDHRQWEALLAELDCAGAILPLSQYRSGAWAWCFPNRLEICFRITQSNFHT